MTQPNWAAAAAPGTIVLFRFPLAESHATAKGRPCLIIGRRVTPDGLRLTLAYGTGAETQSNTGLDLMADAAALAQTGLHRPTRFVLARRITVAANDPRFDLGRESSPVLGVLPYKAQGRLRMIASYLGPALTEDHRRGRPRPPAVRSHRTDQRRITTRRRDGRSTETSVIERRRRSI